MLDERRAADVGVAVEAWPIPGRGSLDAARMARCIIRRMSRAGACIVEAVQASRMLPVDYA